jgi:hypothetical protein
MPISLASTSASSMHGAMVPIATATPTGLNSFAFSNIPQTFQDLRIVMYARDSTAATSSGIYGGFNGDYGVNSNYSFTFIRGDGANASSGRYSNQPFIAADGQFSAASSATGTFGATTWDILNYTNTSTFKSYLNRNACDLNGSGSAYLSVGLWRSTAAINSVLIVCVSTFVAGSTFTLYGIRKVGQ